MLGHKEPCRILFLIKGRSSGNSLKWGGVPVHERTQALGARYLVSILNTVSGTVGTQGEVLTCLHPMKVAPVACRR